MVTQNLNDLHSVLLGLRDAASFRAKNCYDEFSKGYHTGKSVSYQLSADLVADEIKKQFQHSNN